MYDIELCTVYQMTYVYEYMINGFIFIFEIDLLSALNQQNNLFLPMAKNNRKKVYHKTHE